MIFAKITFFRISKNRLHFLHIASRREITDEIGGQFRSKRSKSLKEPNWEFFLLKNDQSHLEGKLLMNMDDNSDPKRVSELKTRFGVNVAQKPSINIVLVARLANI